MFFFVCEEKRSSVCLICTYLQAYALMMAQEEKRELENRKIVSLFPDCTTQSVLALLT
jgi:hypothetical protein